MTIDELITLVNIALGTAQASACPHGVPSGADVDVALIIQAVNVALNGCGVSPAEQGCLTSGGTVTHRDVLRQQRRLPGHLRDRCLRLRAGRQPRGARLRLRHRQLLRRQRMRAAVMPTTANVAARRATRSRSVCSEPSMQRASSRWQRSP